MGKDDMILRHYGILLSHEKERNLANCNNRDGPWGHYANRERQIPWLHLQVESETPPPTKAKKPEFTDIENRLVVAWRRLGGRWKVKRYRLPVIKWVSHGDLLQLVILYCTFQSSWESASWKFLPWEKIFFVNMYGDGCYVDLLWSLFCNTYKYWITTLYTWN